MGEYKHFGSSIRYFTPDDTEDSFYVAGNATLQDILDDALDKWPGIELLDLDISAEHFHTDCLGYGSYDRGDYTDYLVIRRINQGGKK